MRLRLLLLISTALAFTPVMACEFHAEAGSPPASPSSTPANPVTNPTGAAAATTAPATPPVPTRTINTGSMHPSTTDGGI